MQWKPLFKIPAYAPDPHTSKFNLEDHNFVIKDETFSCH